MYYSGGLEPIRESTDKVIDALNSHKLLLANFRERELKEQDDLHRIEEYKDRAESLERENEKIIEAHDMLREAIEKYIIAKESGKVYDFQWQNVLNAYNYDYYLGTTKVNG